MKWKDIKSKLEAKGLTDDTEIEMLIINVRVREDSEPEFDVIIDEKRHRVRVMGR